VLFLVYLLETDELDEEQPNDSHKKLLQASVVNSAH
jgi:hypothetical protein